MGRSDDVLEVIRALLQIIVDKQIIVTGDLLNFRGCLSDPPCNHIPALRSPAPEALQQTFRIRRDDEDQHRIRHNLFDLHGPLRVDLQNDIPALLHLLQNPCFRCPIGMADIGGMLQKSILLRRSVKFLLRDKEIRNAVHLTRSRLPRRHGDGERITAAPLHQILHQRSFSCSGKSGNDYQTSSAVHELPFSIK